MCAAESFCNDISGVVGFNLEKNLQNTHILIPYRDKETGDYKSLPFGLINSSWRLMCCV